jgi:hypothetical protein
MKGLIEVDLDLLWLVDVANESKNLYMVGS